MLALIILIGFYVHVIRMCRIVIFILISNSYFVDFIYLPYPQSFPLRSIFKKLFPPKSLFPYTAALHALWKKIYLGSSALARFTSNLHLCTQTRKQLHTLHVHVFGVGWFFLTIRGPIHTNTHTCTQHKRLRQSSVMTHIRARSKIE